MGKSTSPAIKWLRIFFIPAAKSLLKETLLSQLKRKFFLYFCYFLLKNCQSCSEVVSAAKINIKGTEL